MNIHAEKIQDNKKTIVNPVVQNQSNLESTFQFTDNRHEAIAQRKLHEIANNSQIQQNGKVVQCLMSASAFKRASQTGIGAMLGKETRPTAIQEIDAMLRRYSMIGDAKNSRAFQHTYDLRSKVLHRLQTHVFQTMQQQGYDPNSGHHTALINLLDEIQTEQQRLSAHQIQAKLKIWVPGRDQMSQNQQTTMDTAWDSITHNRGRLTVSENASTTLGGRERVRGFQGETYANMARLMGTPTGRRLLMGLDSGPHDVAVEPTYPDMARNDQRGYIKAYSHEAPGIDREQQHPGGGLTPGLGGDSLVRMLPGYKDSEMLDFDATDQPILSPGYIGLGHELIHALHNQRGVAWDLGTHNPAHYVAGQPLAHYHNPEEQHTIAYQHPPLGGPVPLEQITENMLRADSGLSEREGHTSVPREDVTYSKLRGWLNRGQKLTPRRL